MLIYTNKCGAIPLAALLLLMLLWLLLFSCYLAAGSRQLPSRMLLLLCLLLLLATLAFSITYHDMPYRKCHSKKCLRLLLRAFLLLLLLQDVPLVAGSTAVAAPGTAAALDDDGNDPPPLLVLLLLHSYRRMPAGTEHVFTLDMAHMADGPLSMANTDDEADRSVHMLLTGGGSRSGHDRSVRGGARRDKSVHGGSVHGGSRHVVIARRKSTSVHGAMQSIESCLNEPATAADRAESATAGLYAGLAQGPDAWAADQPMEEMTVPTTVGSSIGFTKTLALHHMPSGLVVASYQLEPSVHGGNANSVHGGKANTLNARN